MSVAFSGSANPKVTSTVNENTAYGALDANFELESGDVITLRGTPNFSAGTVFFAKDSVAQQDTFTISGDYQTGDIINLRLNDVSANYTVTSADVGSASGTYTNAITNKNIVTNMAEALSENANLSDLVSFTVARDMDVTNDDATYPSIAFLRLCWR